MTIMYKESVMKAVSVVCSVDYTLGGSVGGEPLAGMSGSIPASVVEVLSNELFAWVILGGSSKVNEVLDPTCRIPMYRLAVGSSTQIEREILDGSTGVATLTCEVSHTNTEDSPVTIREICLGDVVRHVSDGIVINPGETLELEVGLSWTYVVGDGEVMLDESFAGVSDIRLGLGSPNALGLYVQRTPVDVESEIGEFIRRDPNTDVMQILNWNDTRLDLSGRTYHDRDEDYVGTVLDIKLHGFTIFSGYGSDMPELDLNDESGVEMPLALPTQTRLKAGTRTRSSANIKLNVNQLPG